MRGKAIIIVAPSGTGKSTLIARLVKDFPQLKWSVSCTTRPPREGETHGKEYFFVSVEEFEQKIQRDGFVEWAKVHSNYYGTDKDRITSYNVCYTKLLRYRYLDRLKRLIVNRWSYICMGGNQWRKYCIR